MSNEWTEQELKFLRDNWGKGKYTGATFAKALGKSRSAILGKAFRMGLPKLTKRIGTSTRKSVKRAKPVEPKKAKMPSVVNVKIGDEFVRGPEIMPPTQITDLEEETSVVAKTTLFAGKYECRWPLSGEKENILFCCAPTIKGSSWCTKHYHRVFTPKSILWAAGKAKGD